MPAQKRQRPAATATKETPEALVVEHSAKRRTPKDPSSFEICGLCCAPNTAFNPNNTVKLDIIPQLVDRLIRNGVHAVFVNGTMGEGLSMSVEERKKSLDAWVKASKGKDMAIICHIGCESLVDTCELAKHAEGLKIHGIAVTPPTFFKPYNMDALIEWLAAVSKAAPDTPMYYYHFNDMNGVNFPIHLLLSKASKSVSTLCGTKYTNYNMFEMERALHIDDGKFNILLGREDVFPAPLFSSPQTMLPALTIGLKGGIGATFSALGHEFNLLMQDFAKGDLEEAKKRQIRCNDFAAIITYHGGKYGLGVGPNEILKAILTMSGIDMGVPRTPRPALTPEALALLKTDLEAIHFFDWCDK